MSKEAENLMAAMKELHTLRARVGELETEVETRNEQLNEVDYDLAMLAARAESAEARVKESREIFDITRHRVLRSMGVEDMGHGWFWIESELAAAREEQGLEAKVREALGPRWFELLISRAVTGTWTAHWNKPEPAPTAHRATAGTLPALLRAILEVEAKS